jgi:hypothetical protein
MLRIEWRTALGYSAFPARLLPECFTGSTYFIQVEHQDILMILVSHYYSNGQTYRLGRRCRSSDNGWISLLRPWWASNSRRIGAMENK